MSGLVDDAIKAKRPDQRLPAPTPVRHILAQPGEAAFPEEVRQNRSPPDQSGRPKAAPGPLAQLRPHLVAQLPLDTAALPLKSRLRRPAGTQRPQGPEDWRAAHGEGLALRTDLGRRLSLPPWMSGR